MATTTQHVPRAPNDGNTHGPSWRAGYRAGCESHAALLAALQRLVIWDECGTSDDAVLDSIMSEARAAIAACEVQS